MSSLNVLMWIFLFFLPLLVGSQMPPFLPRNRYEETNVKHNSDDQKPFSVEQLNLYKLALIERDVTEKINKASELLRKVDVKLDNFINRKTDPTYTLVNAKIENLRKGIQLLIANSKINISNNNKNNYISNCADVKEKSGIYVVQPPGSNNNSFLVKCEVEDENGGWTVIQNRFDGREDFYRGWNDYKNGFGNLEGEFWLGLDKIYFLTNKDVNEMMIILEDGVKARYSTFSVGPETLGFPLHVLGNYIGDVGDAGDSFLYHAGAKFSTKDVDQDQWLEGSCAQTHGGAWWYKGCDSSNLNGRYFGGAVSDENAYQGMYWATYKGPKYSLLKTKIMIRPIKTATFF